ncbi:ligase-associated DNA damage response endonuclease PdeM [Sphingobacterium faecium]|uniref:ligase-associated DNA damage response endonuclease PdeM n=1 Tax=Sphingobacterium faecium TaxID=34087 RepID=UPI003209B967
MIRIIKRGIELILDQKRALYIPYYQLLVISDFHLGKSGHFRKEGLQIPKQVSETDITRLDHLVAMYNPKTLLVTGDMFHHHHNMDLEEFRIWRAANKTLEIILVKGNHDKLAGIFYEQLAINLFSTYYEIGDFCFVHERKDAPDHGKYIFSGHIHPGILLKGPARQRLKLPCFVFDDTSALLPAFSLFTGLYLIQAKTGQEVFAITANRVTTVATF